MAKRRITITIDSNLDEWIDAASKCYGRSQSDIVRICLREFHEAQPNRFSTRDKARMEKPEAWRILRGNVEIS